MPKWASTYQKNYLWMARVDHNFSNDFKYIFSFATIDNSAHIAMACDKWKKTVFPSTNEMDLYPTELECSTVSEC